MSKHRIYIPSETHRALYPAPAMSTCVECGVRHAIRSSIPHLDSGEDDPEKCLACNRKRWSRLFNDNRPVVVDSDNDGNNKAGIVPITRGKAR